MSKWPRCKTIAAVWVREKAMARVPCDHHLWQWALAVVTSVTLGSVPGLCRIKKGVKVAFLVTWVLLGMKLGHLA